ncbi:hypothetical protein [Micromonospora sp. NPDC004704]
MNGLDLVAVGDIVNAEEDDYYYRDDRGEVIHGAGDLHMRVTAVLMSAVPGSWVTLRGRELPSGQPEGPERVIVVRHRALPGFSPEALS